jgi:hypothetical protein
MDLTFAMGIIFSKKIVKFKPMRILFPMGKANNPPSKRLS